MPDDDPVPLSRPTFTVVRESTLSVDADTLWERVGTMDGVNAELMPLVRMSTPRGAGDYRIEDAPLDRVAFVSTLLLFGVIPVDRYSLRILEVSPGRGFVESSTSWSYASWRHERTLEPVGESTRVVDRVTVAPRVRLLLPIVRRIVGLVFSHRHRVLARVWGSAPG